jgi:hypothetical protein
MARIQRWTIVLRGDENVVEVVLNDKDGLRASKHCSDGQEMEACLAGWNRYYGCDVSSLFASAMDRTPPEVVRTIVEWAPRMPSRFRFLSPEEAMRLLELGKGSYRPQPIRDLQKQIAAETRAAEFVAVNTGVIEPERVRQIDERKLDLDRLCGAWAEGGIS